MIQLIQGDCLEELKQIENNSVDSIVCDPPYELGFMGKSWDSTGIANNVEMWKQCLRVLKPGGHLLAFSGTRTYHRMASAIEDAGFEVRDMLEWIYASGFPKSLNVGKAVDKLQGNERQVVRDRTGAMNNADNSDAQSFTKGDVGFKTHFTETKGNSEWEGWGTALKPAHEPICMARKPLSEKTVAQNVLKWGTGGINIDESRVKTEDNLAKNYASVRKYDDVMGERVGRFGFRQGKDSVAEATESTALGRFPANLIHDNSEEVRECFPYTKHGGSTYNEGTNNNWLGRNKIKYVSTVKDSGNASRFFKSIIYQAKASKSERNKGCEGIENEKFTAGNYSQSPVCKTCDKTLNGTNNHSNCSGEVYYREMDSKKTSNNHPTVKPIALMEYLIKMVTPKGGIVLDPFMGSGSTGIAAKKNGYSFIGIEMECSYIEIAKNRIENAKDN